MNTTALLSPEVEQGTNGRGLSENTVPGPEAGAAAGSAPVAPGKVGLPAAPPALHPEAEHDAITRRRDRSGHRLGWIFWHSLPTIDDVPLEESHIEAAIQVIEEAGLPGRAHTLRQFYEQKLRGSLHRFTKVRDDEYRRLNEANGWATGENARIQTGQEALRDGRNRAVAPEEQALRALDEPLEKAHREAADRCAHAGGAYNPTAPDERCVLRHDRTPLEVLAPELGLPTAAEDSRTHIPAHLGVLATILVGLMVGISIALMAGVVSADNILRHPLMLCIFGLIGWAAAYLGSAAIKHSQKYASERYYLGHPWTNWAPFMVLALGVDGTILAMDACVEQAGLLKTASVRNLALALGQSHPSTASGTGVYFLAAILLSFGYVVYFAWEGFAYGRRFAVQNRLLSAQERQFQDIDQRRRDDPAVQTALESLAGVNEIQRQRAQWQERIVKIAAPYEERIVELEGQRKPLQGSLDERAEQRIQDAGDNLAGAQAEFDRMFEAALAEAEGRGGALRRLIRRWQSGRSRRMKITEPNKRGS